MGGEKLRPTTVWPKPWTSPPHRRGKALKDSLSPLHVRITPAWAGKRWAWDALSTSCWDYPRAGREKQTGTVYAVLPYGSPPRRRGKVLATFPVLVLVISAVHALAVVQLMHERLALLEVFLLCLVLFASVVADLVA